MSLLTHPVAAAVAGPPVITQQPTNAIAGTGEDIAFTVAATDTNLPPQPLTFRWRVNGSVITVGNVTSSASSSTLVVSNLVSAVYSVIVSNAVTNVVSSNATLLVVNPVPRRLGTGLVTAVTNVGVTNVLVPITLRATGRENFVSFTLNYTNAFTNVMFTTTNANAVITTNLTLNTLTNITANPTNSSGPRVTNTFKIGTAGINIRLTSGTFSAGQSTLGTFQFDWLGTNNTDFFNAGLTFSTGLSNPVPLTATNLNGAPLAITAEVEPCLSPVTPVPALQDVSGFFISSMNVRNPGLNTMPAVDVLALGLGVDARTNAITFTNSQAARTSVPLGDPVVFATRGNGSNSPVDLTSSNAVLPYAQLYNVQPGESRRVTLEFHVPDHVTTPSNAAFALFRGLPLNPTVFVNPTPLTIATNAFSGVFYMEFRTAKAHDYYIQYTDRLPFSPANANTVFPAVTGTGGSVRWVDNGSPKTDVASTNGARFFRVLQTP